MFKRFHVQVPIINSYYNTADDFFFAVPLERCPLTEAVLQAETKNTNEPLMQQVLTRTKAEINKRGGVVDCQMAVCLCGATRCRHCAEIINNHVVCNSGVSLDPGDYTTSA